MLVGEAYTPEEEAQQVLGEIQRLKSQAGHSLGDCAVMYRVNAQSRALEDGCLRRSIPYRLIGGVRFYQRREVKDVIAYLRVVQNPYDDVSLLRIINVPPRGIGQRTVEQLVHDARTQGIPVYAAAQLAAEAEQQGQSSRDRGSRTGRAVSRFLYIINALIESTGSLPVEELIDAIMERTGYREHLRAEGEQGQERLENIAELRATARELQPMEPTERLAASWRERRWCRTWTRWMRARTQSRLSRCTRPRGWSFPWCSSWGWRRECCLTYAHSTTRSRWRRSGVSSTWA